VWLPSDSAQPGCATDYPSLLMHATSREEDDPSLFCQIVCGASWPGVDKEEDETVVTAMFVVSEGATVLVDSGSHSSLNAESDAPEADLCECVCALRGVCSGMKVRFAVERMFESLSACAEAIPNEGLDDEGDGDDAFVDASMMDPSEWITAASAELSAEQLEALSHLEGKLTSDAGRVEGRFEDAE
jgi:hypothetical protein